MDWLGLALALLSLSVLVMMCGLASAMILLTVSYLMDGNDDAS